uniref:B30.2/SPRY domain-containing protein n=1 Tax=Meloidogyne hapla TaxID=6305 RepID=A0A1I8B4P2_MELHA
MSAENNPNQNVVLDNPITIRGENFFSRAAGASLAYSLFYFEVTLTDIFNMEESSFFIGLHSFDNNDVCLMFNENNFMCKNLGIIPFQYNLSSEDVIGCGVIYPPTANTYEAPHVFFTINGSKFGKTIRPYTPCTDNLLPMVCLDCCSIAANFGQRDFRYDVNNHISHGETFHLDEWTKPN